MEDSPDDDHGSRLILVSNRGPLEHRREDDRRVIRRGGGGLVTALSGLVDELGDTVWVCAAMTDEDVAVAHEHPNGVRYGPGGGDAGEGGVRVRFLPLDPRAKEQFYGVIANPLLWFIQHYMYDLSRAPSITRREIDAFEHGYAAVNSAFADVVADELGTWSGRARVMVQDYHFYLLPGLLRARVPGALLQHFVHIPWPQPDSWRVLPPAMREAVFEGLLGNDIVGFHTDRYARNFLLGCQELLGLAVDLAEMTARFGERVVHARSYPISVNPDVFEERAATEAVGGYEQELAAGRREHLVLRVDRTEPSKNIVRGFLAFDILLDDHPELAGQVTFLALLQPSRLEVPEYADYLEQIQRVAADVNLKHGRTDWQPIDLRVEENFDLAVAAYKQFDVLVVNAIFDGMNLVAKEALLVNERDGVLALSENTGAHQELGPFALTLYPFDLQQQADTLAAALVMPADERRARREECVAHIRQNDVAHWLRMQLFDLDRLEADRRDEAAAAARLAQGEPMALEALPPELASRVRAAAAHPDHCVLYRREVPADSGTQIEYEVEARSGPQTVRMRLWIRPDGSVGEETSTLIDATRT